MVIPKYSASLINADELSRRTKVSVDRILELAAAEFIPHWNVDGKPLFHISEAQNWIRDNLSRRIKGREIPTHLCLTSNRKAIVPEDIPLELRKIEGLVDMTDLLVRQSGIYFLLLEEMVVYVGQSTNVCNRVGQHKPAKEFDRVFFMPWPASDLDRIETAFIRLLHPYQNYDSLGRLGVPSQANYILPRLSKEDKEVLALAMPDTANAYASTN